MHMMFWLSSIGSFTTNELCCSIEPSLQIQTYVLLSLYIIVQKLYQQMKKNELCDEEQDKH